MGVDFEHRRDEKTDITGMTGEEEDENDSEGIETTLLRKNSKRWRGKNVGFLPAASVSREIEQEEESVDDDVDMGHGKNASSSDNNIQEVQTSSSTKLDLETVLAEQDEYDLFCPKCKSCITERVILRKRKRTSVPMKKIQPDHVVADFAIPVVADQEEGKNQPDHVVAGFAIPVVADQEEGKIQPDHVSTEVPIPVVADQVQGAGQDDETEVYRCLSCFSFFTPTLGGGYKLFNLFGGKEKIQTEPKITNPVVVPAVPGDNSAEQAVIHIASEAALRIPEHYDILKPIVYGGLIEAIISSAIVLSAAGAGISTVDIVALALARLIGGLVLKLVDIWELHDEEYHNQQSNDTRYWSILGSRNHFKMNTAVALLSYILAGIGPIAIYWLAQPSWMFNIGMGSDYSKVVATTAVSVVLIGLLSLIKAHVQMPPKTYFKTCFKYLGIGLTIWIISFGSGFIIQKQLPTNDLVLRPHPSDMIQYD